MDFSFQSDLKSLEVGCANLNVWENSRYCDDDEATSYLRKTSMRSLAPTDAFIVLEKVEILCEGSLSKTKESGSLQYNIPNCGNVNFVDIVFMLY